MLSISRCRTATFPEKANHSGGGYILASRSFNLLFQESANFCPTFNFLSYQLCKRHFPLAQPVKKFGMCQVLLGWPSAYLNRWKQGRLEHESALYPVIRIVFQPPSNLPTVRQLKPAAGRTSVPSKAWQYISANGSIIKCIDRISFNENRISPNCSYKAATWLYSSDFEKVGQLGNVRIEFSLPFKPISFPYLVRISSNFLFSHRWWRGK